MYENYTLRYEAMKQCLDARLQKRGLLNCFVCQLCKRDHQTATYLLFKYRYSIVGLELYYRLARHNQCKQIYLEQLGDR
jgi:hypothetical protein